MKPFSGYRSALMNLLRDERGAFLIIVTVYLPVIVGFFTLAVDMSYVYRTRNMLQVTAESAALAGTTQLPDAISAVSFAKQYAAKNMPTASYGSVLVDKDVVVGMWPQSCVAGQNCFVSNATQPCGVQCNAVQVTTRMAKANNNALPLIFAPLIGLTNFDVNSTAVAVYGSDPASPTWNVGIVEDISQSFSAEIAQAKAADQALLTCMNNNSAAGSTLGIGLFTGTGTSYQSPLPVTTNYNDLTNKISAINGCGKAGMPECSGTNIGGGINTAIAQICPGSTCSNPAAYKPALVIVTDGQPTKCGSSGCGNDTPQTYAEKAAQTAANLGMDIFTIYFCSDGNCGSSAAVADATWLAKLVKGKGIALKTPNSSQMATLMATVCSTSHQHRLVW
jgi:Flp pilus assembly protein TadG